MCTETVASEWLQKEKAHFIWSTQLTKSQRDRDRQKERQKDKETEGQRETERERQ